MDDLTPSDRYRIAKALRRRFTRPAYATRASHLFRRAVGAYRASIRGKLRPAIFDRALMEFFEHVRAVGMPLAEVRRRRGAR